jgi:Domain of unknown function (DUF4349)
MKTFSKYLTMLLVPTLFGFSCQAPREEASAEGDFISTAVTDSVANRIFIRKADLCFKVADALHTVETIERIVHQHEGYVLLSNLQNINFQKEIVPFSSDSAWEIRRFKRQNALTFRVPSHQLDTVLRQMRHLAVFLDHRKISADEVTFDMEGAELNQKRHQRTNQQMQRIVKTKEGGLNQSIDAAEALDQQEATWDDTRLNAKRLKDEVAFSEVTVHLYESEQIKQQAVAYWGDVPQSPFGLRLVQSLTGGWKVLQDILILILNFWPIWLIVITGAGYARSKIRGKRIQSVV